MEPINNLTSNIFIVAGLLYGDEGKGTTVEYLVKRTGSNLVVRYNGGPQAAHHIVLEDRKIFHCFSQFSSGSFFTNCHTLLSKYMVISPHSLLREAEKLISKHSLTNIMQRLHVDYQCFIVTPYHQMLNRVKEVLRGSGKHGSTGLGVGVCVDEAFATHKDFFPLSEILNSKKTNNENENNFEYNTLQVKDLIIKNECDVGKLKTNENYLRNKINKIISEKLEQSKNLIKNYISENKLGNSEKEKIIEKANHIIYDFINKYTSNDLVKFYLDFYDNYNYIFCDGTEIIKQKILNKENIVFEGAQGALLDRVYGIFPHVTKTLCSDHNAISLIMQIENCNRDVDYRIIKIGVLRAYSSRHGNGPFVTHKMEYNDLLREEHNMHSQWQDEFKVGPFDVLGSLYGIDIFKPDYLSITCLDRIFSMVENNRIPICTKYYKSIDNLNHDELEILDNEKLFKIENSKKLVFIKRILKREIKEAYFNLDLVTILKDAAPFFENIDLNNKNNLDEKSYFTNEEQIELMSLGVSNLEFDIYSKFLKVIKEKLKIPIAIISLGPTQNDKLVFKNEIFI